MMAGTVKMPTPITFDTISATPSRTRNAGRSRLPSTAASVPPALPAEGESATLDEVCRLCPVIFPDLALRSKAPSTLHETALNITAIGYGLLPRERTRTRFHRRLRDAVMVSTHREIVLANLLERASRRKRRHLGLEAQGLE